MLFGWLTTAMLAQAVLDHHHPVVVRPRVVQWPVAQHTNGCQRRPRLPSLMSMPASGSSLPRVRKPCFLLAHSCTILVASHYSFMIIDLFIYSINLLFPIPLLHDAAVANTTVVINHLAVSWYNLFFDGTRVAEGPTRFIGTQPFFDTTTVLVPQPGNHVISIHAHSCGEQTRILLKNNPVVWCSVASSDHAITALTWRCAPLDNYASEWQRMSTLLGYVPQSVCWNPTLSMHSPPLLSALCWHALDMLAPNCNTYKTL